MIGILLAVVAFGLLIIVHELGHYVAARRMGVPVERFSVGFGPVVWSRRRGETEWVLSAIPFGGYVQIGGVLPEDGAPPDPAAFHAKPAWQRFVVYLAGPAMNYVAAVVIAVALLTTIGMQEGDARPVVGTVLPGGAAARAGLQAGDLVVAAGDAPVESWTALVQAVRSHPGSDLLLLVRRAGHGPGTAPEEITLRPDDAGGVGRAGIAPALVPVHAGFLTAIRLGFVRTNEKAVEMVSGLGQVLARKQKAELQGPVGIAQEMARSSRAGAAAFLSMVWLISIMLAVFNLLPIPALDGGKLLFIGFEMVTGRPVNRRVEAIVHTVGFVALGLLIVGVTLFGDLPRLFRR